MLPVINLDQLARPLSFHVSATSTAEQHDVLIPLQLAARYQVMGAAASLHAQGAWLRWLEHSLRMLDPNLCLPEMHHMQLLQDCIDPQQLLLPAVSRDATGSSGHIPLHAWAICTMDIVSRL